ncbi:MAG: choice-of-anchor D domain-containing protein, partial [Gemmatimonadales bacterium]|nr:choice-of-anchor D domain-containing protein [Gemmatimonadales bacterium]
MNSSYLCRNRHAKSFLALLMFLLIGLAGTTGLAQEMDKIGIYFDPAFTQTELSTGTLPTMATAYLVLNNPSASAGINGWECRLKLEGPCSLSSTQFEGTAMNFETPPFFMVGISGDPLPSGEKVLLATFNILVSDQGAIVFSLLPLYQASLPDQMSYATPENPGELFPMTTVTDHPIVAFINASTDPICDLSPSYVSFPDTRIGQQIIRSFTIENPGVVPLNLDIGFSEENPSFTLANTPGGPLTIEPLDSFEVEIAFIPFFAEYYECTLQLGSTCSDVTVYGTGREPIVSWGGPTSVNFGEVPVGTREVQSFAIYNSGEVDLSIQTSLDESCEAFSITTGFNGILPVGSTGYISLDFQPTAVGTYNCTLDMGDIVTPIQVTGSGYQPNVSWIVPEILDFGEVAMGESSILPLSITNTGETDIEIAYSLEAGCTAFTLSETAPYLLPAGQSHNTGVTFTPSAFGETTCSLSFGETIPAIPLTGLCLNQETDFRITPVALVFPVTVVGSTNNQGVLFENTGNTVIHIDPALTSPCEGITIASGSGSFDVAPGNSHNVVIEFAPLMVDSFAAELSFGVDLPTVSITGTSADPNIGCSVYPTEMDFGLVTVGNSKTLFIQVANIGNQLLVIQPEDNSSVFTVGNPISIEPGATGSVAVTFHPLAEGSWGAVVDLGQNACSNVVCSGTGVAVPGWDQNLVGFTFEAASLNYNYFEFSTFASPGSVVTAYLAMINPTSGYPLVGWECCASIEGPGSFISWEIDGLPINALTEPCFMVGLGSPQPYPTPFYILATAQILVAGSEEDIVLQLKPAYFASIPGEMAWVANAPDPYLIPMRTPYGVPEVAFINSGGMVAVEAPDLTAEVSGSTVNLSWSLPKSDFDGCHVFRGREPLAAEQLSQKLLSATDGTFTFSDLATGFEPGTVLYYSYALVRNDRVQTHSPEVQVTLKNLPPAATQLLPNVPNPFNPQTEIRFELKDPGPVRVTIYDVSGRLVRTLLNEGLGAGQHSRTWYGKDDKGRQAPSSAYYIQLETEGKVYHRKVMLL